MAKPAAGRYQPGAGWVKVRTRATADYVIGGVTGSLAWPVALLLGRFDSHGVLRYTGQTQPIKADQRRDLAAALRGLSFQGAGSGHPWPRPLPTSWSAGLSGREPLAFTPVEATLVAEVEVDTALDGPLGHIRHPCRHVRVRLDLHPRELNPESDPAAFATPAH